MNDDCGNHPLPAHSVAVNHLCTCTLQGLRSVVVHLVVITAIELHAIVTNQVEISLNRSQAVSGHVPDTN